MPVKRATSHPWDEKQSLRAEEPQVGQWHEDVESNDRTTILFFL